MQQSIYTLDEVAGLRSWVRDYVSSHPDEVAALRRALGLDRPAPVRPSVPSQYGYALTFDDLPLTEAQFAKVEQYMREHRAELQRYDAGESWKLAEAHARGRRPEAPSSLAVSNDAPLSAEQVLRLGDDFLHESLPSAWPHPTRRQDASACRTGAGFAD